jgi:hypothetical protein
MLRAARKFLISLVAATALCAAAPAAADADMVFVFNVTGGPVGEEISLPFHITGGDSPDGTVTVRLYPNSFCSGTPLLTQEIQATGNGDYETDAVLADEVGEYTWLVEYSGDPENTPETMTCGTAPKMAITKRVPTISASVTSGVIGGTVTATATLDNEYKPSGDVTFRIWDNDTCTGQPVDDPGADTVPGSGFFTRTYIPFEVGTYKWTATYGGDFRNQSATTPCAAAPVSNVIKATTEISGASPNDTVGRPLFAIVVLDGGEEILQGTMKFELFGPGSADCSGTPIFSPAPITVLRAGSYASGNHTSTAPGQYSWRATYSGDEDNNPSTTCFGVTVTPRPPAEPAPPVTRPAKKKLKCKRGRVAKRGKCVKRKKPRKKPRRRA